MVCLVQYYKKCRGYTIFRWYMTGSPFSGFCKITRIPLFQLYIPRPKTLFYGVAAASIMGVDNLVLIVILIIPEYVYK